jgi:hypothetical protein
MRFNLGLTLYVCFFVIGAFYRLQTPSISEDKKGAISNTLRHFGRRWNTSSVKTVKDDK